MSEAGVRLVRSSRQARLRIRTEAFVRSCLVDVFKQDTTDAQVSEIATKIIATLPRGVRSGLLPSACEVEEAALLSSQTGAKP